MTAHLRVTQECMPLRTTQIGIVRAYCVELLSNQWSAIQARKVKDMQSRVYLKAVKVDSSSAIRRLEHHIKPKRPQVKVSAWFFEGKLRSIIPRLISQSQPIAKWDYFLIVLIDWMEESSLYVTLNYKILLWVLVFP